MENGGSVRNPADTSENKEKRVESRRITKIHVDATGKMRIHLKPNESEM